MPKVKPLTPSLAKRQAYENRTKALATGLIVYKTQSKLTNEQMAAQLKIGKNKLPKLLDGRDTMVTVGTFWALLDMAGLEIRRKELKLDA